MAIRMDRRRVLRAVAAVPLLLLAVGALATTVVIPRLVGGAALNVMSGSMSPTYPVGSVVVVRPVDPADVGVGDVITYANPSGSSFTTHRVEDVRMGADGREFTTKGDANSGADPEPVPASAVRGRVWFHVPMLGQVRDAVASPWGLAAIVALGGIVAGWGRIGGLLRGRPSPGGTTNPSVRPPSLDRGATALSVEDAPAPMAPMPAGVAADAAFGETPIDELAAQLMLIEVSASPADRPAIVSMASLAGGRIVHVGRQTMALTISGSPAHLDATQDLLAHHGVVRTARSQVVTFLEPTAGARAEIEDASPSAVPGRAPATTPTNGSTDHPGATSAATIAGPSGPHLVGVADRPDAPTAWASWHAPHGSRP